VVNQRWFGFAVFAAVAVATCGSAYAQPLNEHCVVSILNRTAQVRADGSWDLPNIPAGFGPVRARATCVENGVTRSGQSELFTIVAGRMNAIPPILLGATTPIPQTLELAASPTTLLTAGATTQIAVTARYPGGASNDVTSAGTGTTYLTTNSTIATVSAGGLVTAVRSGTVLIRAANEGTAGLLTIVVALAGDADGDGIGDDVEVTEGLNPNDPTDALLDPDRDGLSNRDEITRGTNLRNPDTDDDGIRDGEEVAAGADGFVTNPLLADTDGDGVRDGLEIAAGSDPTNPASLNLAGALSRIEVTPTSFALTVNAIMGEASIQLQVTGFLTDNTTINLTSTLRGTNYASSDLNTCNFGSPDGRVFAAANGSCTITVTNSGFSAAANGTVSSFTPVAHSFVAIPGFANNVEVSGDFAYVAAGASGLQVVNVANRAAPVVVAARDTPGNANDVKIVGNLAFVADGSSGLQIIDITNPLSPTIAGSLETPGDAWDVAVSGNRAYVADGALGLRIIDVSNPAAPRLLGVVDPPGTQKGVAIDPARDLAVLASGTSGIHVVNVADPAAPVVVGTAVGGDARDVDLAGSFAVVADYSRSMTTVDLTVPTAPLVLASTASTLGGLLQDVAVSGRFALGADVLFVNGVPIVDIGTPATPLPRAILNFSAFRDDDGQGIAADGAFVYLAAALGSAFIENGTSGNSRLYIGQYVALEDRAGVPPTVAITSPQTGATVVHGARVPVQVSATDDVAVAGVTFVVNGQNVFTDTTAPYEFTATAPSSGITLTLTASAVDLGGNTATAAAVTLNLIPDPGTIVVGRVLDTNRAPLAGATVSAGGQSAVTAGDGSFSIAGVPTALGDIVVTATAVIDGVARSAISASAPAVVGGTTNVGDIILGSGNRMVVVNSTANTATVIDISGPTSTVVATVPTGGSQSIGASVTPDGTRALISNFSSGTVTFLDLTATPPVLIGSPLTNGTTESTAITSTGRFAVTADGSTVGVNVSSIDIASRTIVNSLVLPATGVAITPDNSTVLLNDFNANRIRVLSLSPTGVLTDTGVVLINPGSGPMSVAVAPNGRFALVTNNGTGDVTVLRISAAGNVTASTTRIPVGSSPNGVAFTPDGSKAYVAGGLGVAVLRIDAQDNVTDSGVRIALPNGAPNSFFGVGGLAIGPNGRAYVSNFNSNTVTVLDTQTDAIIGTIPVGAGPAGIGVPR
jgi:YVTN family beta-propeller protein